MKTVVIGVGHVGLVTAACLARWGHTVVGLDDDAARIDTLRDGGMPFYEPGLDELVREGVDAGRLTFTTDLAAALAGASVAFVCVGTPSLPGGAPNLAFVERVGRDCAAAASGDLVLVEKSTVPANTGVRLEQVIARELQRLSSDIRIEVASNPEFLREGTAVEDTLHPDRIVVGTASTKAAAVLREVYATVIAEDGCPVVEADLQTSELIKHASNAFLATKISFINAVARICDEVGADVQTVADGMGHDSRIGRAFLHAGLGYGGSCFPKDVDGFLHLAESVGVPFGLLSEVRKINEGQRELVLDHLRAELWHLEGKTVTLLGAAFKPGTDDLREAPAMYLADALLEEGAHVRIYDPVALPRVEKRVPAAELFDSPLPALQDAHAAVVCTEWDALRSLTPADFVSALAYPIVVDGRNVYDPPAMLAAGIHYRAIGRGARVA